MKHEPPSLEYIGPPPSGSAYPALRMVILERQLVRRLFRET